MTSALTSLSGYVISALTIAGMIVLVALNKATFAEAGPLIAALAGGHLVAGTTTGGPAAPVAAVVAPVPAQAPLTAVPTTPTTV